MRKKEEIIKDNYHIIATLPVDRESTVKHGGLILEVLVDIRDVLQDRLISLDNTLLKYIIPKQ